MQVFLLRHCQQKKEDTVTARIIGIDLSLLHTGIAVSTIDGNIIYSGRFSVNSPENMGVENREMQQVARMA